VPVIADGFLEALPGGGGPPADAELRARIERTFAELYTRAQQAWPGITVDPAVFAGHVGGRLEEASLLAALERLDGLHTNDLYLACAVGRDVPGSRDAFVRALDHAVAGAVRTIETSVAFIDEVRQRLHEHLLVTERGRARLLQYKGRASLATWVGVTAQRIALDLVRSERAQRRAADQAAEAEAMMAELDPELRYLKSRYRDAFRDALAVAVRHLPQRLRTVLRLQTVGGLTLARIARLMTVDESTACRWAQRARELILAETQQGLQVRLGVELSEVPSLVRLVTSQIDLSIVRLLDDAGDAPT
jgi:RNA polymerase sigma-70 factor (ECF subfamily)